MPGDLQEGAGGQGSTVLQLLDEGNYFVPSDQAQAQLLFTL